MFPAVSWLLGVGREKTNMLPALVKFQFNWGGGILITSEQMYKQDHLSGEVKSGRQKTQECGDGWGGDTVLDRVSWLCREPERMLQAEKTQVQRCQRGCKCERGDTYRGRPVGAGEGCREGVGGTGASSGRAWWATVSLCCVPGVTGAAKGLVRGAARSLRCHTEVTSAETGQSRCCSGRN